MQEYFHKQENIPVGCALPTSVVPVGGDGGMMSLPFLFHVPSGVRGYDVTSCLVPCSLQGWCLVPGGMALTSVNRMTDV